MTDIEISDVDELQAIENDLTADYVLVGDIGASGTLTWNRLFGTWVYLDDTDDYVISEDDIGSHFDGSNDFSLEILCYIDDDNVFDGYTTRLFGPANSWAGSFGLEIRDGYLRYRERQNDDSGTIRTVTFGRFDISNIETDKWHHFVLTRDKSTPKLTAYVDGVEVNSTNLAVDDLDYTNRIVINGKNTISGGTTTNRKKMKVNQANIYTKALSSEEVTKAYNKNYSELIDYRVKWCFDEGEGTIVYDGSTNEDDGTIVGGSWEELIWSPSTTYKKNDYILHDGSNYYQLQDEYTSGAEFDEAEWIETTLNAGDYLGFDPIGDPNNPFIGSFDGDGHEVTGLYINRSDESYVGLFGHADTSSVVENIGVVDVNITGDGNAGGLLGRNRGDVSDSYATGSVTGTGDYGRGTGGLVGWLTTEGIVRDCYADVSVSGDTETGGLVGYMVRRVTTENSYAIGEVSGSGGRVGSLVGATWDPSGDNSYLNYSYANSDINPSLSLVGSLNVGAGETIVTGSSLRTTDEMTHIYHRELSFDGEDDYVDTTNLDNFGANISNAWEIIFSVKHEMESDAILAGAINDNDDTALRIFHGITGSIGGVNLWIRNKNNTEVIRLDTGDININDNNWHLVSIAHNGDGKLSISVDGIQEAEADTNTNTLEYTNFDSRWFYGTNSDRGTPDSRYFEGKFAYFKMTSQGNVIADWPMNEGEGTTVYDESTNNNDGTIHGATWVGSYIGWNLAKLKDWVDEKWIKGDHATVTDHEGNSGYPALNFQDIKAYFNGATKRVNTLVDRFTGAWSLYFDGRGDYIEIDYSNTFDNLVDGMAVSAWIYPHSGANRIVDFWDTGDDDGNTFVLNVEEDVDGDNDGVRLLVRGSDGNLYSASTPFTDGYENWYHVVGVYDKENLRVYLDSVETIGDSYSENLEKRDGEMWIGKGASYFTPETYEFDGLIDDVRIYDRALSESEITELYNERYKELGDEVAHWKLNEGKGEVVYDSSENNNWGDIIGATWKVFEGNTARTNTLIDAFNGATRRVNTLVDAFNGVTRRTITKIDVFKGVTRRNLLKSDSLKGVTERITTLKDAFNGATKRINTLVDAFNGVTRRTITKIDVFKGVTRRNLLKSDTFKGLTKRINTLKDTLNGATRKINTLIDTFKGKTLRDLRKKLHIKPPTLLSYKPTNNRIHIKDKPTNNRIHIKDKKLYLNMSQTYKKDATGQDIEATLLDNENKPVDLTDATEVKIHFMDREGETIEKKPVTIENAEEGEIKYEWEDNDPIETKGIYQVEIIVTDSSGENHFPSQRNKTFEVI